MLFVDHRFVRHGLRERDVDRRAKAESGIEFARDPLLRAFGRTQAAAGTDLFVDAFGFQPDRRLEIADKPVQMFEFGISVQLDVRVLRDLHHPRRQDTLRTVERRERLRQLRHVAADRRLFLDQDHLMTAVGDIQRGLYSGDAAADHQRLLGNRHFDRLQRLVAFHFLDQPANDVDRFRSRGFSFFVHPRAMLAQVGHLAQVRVQPRFGTGPPERRLVHPGRTGGHHHAVEFLLLDGLADQRLSRIGTHILIIGGKCDSVELRGFGRHLFTVDRSPDIFAAMANKNSYFRHFRIFS